MKAKEKIKIYRHRFNNNQTLYQIKGMLESLGYKVIVK